MNSAAWFGRRVGSVLPTAAGEQSQTGLGSCAFVIPWNLQEVGGVNEVVKNLCFEFARGGHYRPIVMINDAAHGLPSQSEASGRLTIHVRLRAPWTGSLRSALAYLGSLPAAMLSLLRLCRTHRLSVINVHYPTLSAFTFVLLRKVAPQRLALILSFHGADVTSLIGSRGVERMLWQAIIAGADRLVVCSDSLRDTFLQAFPESADRLCTIHNGLDLERTRAELDHGECPCELRERRYVLSVATFEEKKGLDVLLQSFRLLALHDPELLLVLIGRHGASSGKIRRMILEQGLETRVRVYEDVAHARVLAVMQRAALFVLPSRKEPFGIVLLEAGACQVPTVATRVGGIPEVIRDGETGLLVAAEDSEALAAQMSRLLGDAAIASALAQAMHQRVVSRFTWQSAYRKYEALIAEAHQRPRSSVS